MFVRKGQRLGSVLVSQVSTEPAPRKRSAKKAKRSPAKKAAAAKPDVKPETEPRVEEASSGDDSAHP